MSDAQDWADSRWLPPTPHREAVLEKLAGGIAHIREQGHGKPPLFVSDHGGVIELHKVRLREFEWHYNDGGHEVCRAKMLLVDGETEDIPEGVTRHMDVCGSLNNLKTLLKRDPSEMDDELLADAVYMCQRMLRRWKAYQEFAARVADIVARMQAVTFPDMADPVEEAQVATALWEAGKAGTPEGYEEIAAHLDAIRDMADDVEKVLHQYHDGATVLAALYENVRGARDWGIGLGDRLAEVREPDFDFEELRLVHDPQPAGQEDT